ncbi:hypothetical protein [Paenibacillus sp. FSL R7-0272]|uniref:hypothetical protein n=1 Tax=Paenibacillus sp. FSL R7-0272 TaxID=2921679 RepID=UPI0030EE142B
MKTGDVLIYSCVIIGAGIGLIMDYVFPGVLIGLGAGYLLKYVWSGERKNKDT